MPIWIYLVIWLSRVIFVILFLLSIYSWSIILKRKKFFKNHLTPLPLSDLSIGSMENFKKNNPQNFMSRYLAIAQEKKSPSLFEKKKQLLSAEIRQQSEQGLPTLASLGSTAPFIGLLGTVLSIIVSFGELSKGKGDMNQVMYSLAEALLLTAVGLVVAIPAVISYNYFQNKIKTFFQSAESLLNYYFINESQE
ncbi:MAG: MotA/TolQ/ExbB proton channel family protein [Bacteriovoracaceae bacterium]|nr:MotA/TolQ/ExbB proton channel family protein [Bacteriovoracaceae bacterium]